jgi:Ser/Thr protein kinase RdoA (MazF antagonist)
VDGARSLRTAVADEASVSKMPATTLCTGDIPKNILSHWSTLADRPAWRVRTGLINRTFLVEGRDGSKAIVQRLHPVFDASVNLDVAAVTSHVAAKGLLTPLLIPTDEGTLCVRADGEVWRALTFVAGHTRRKVKDSATAHQAGLLVGRFHNALSDLEHTYHSHRANVHDTQAHLARLIRALEEHPEHTLRDAVAHQGELVLAASADLSDLGVLPRRHTHGDLKISNLLFDDAGRGLCLIDLDTLGRLIWPIEMGDALRSWCNPREEDQSPAVFDLELFEAAVTGYRQVVRKLITASEWEALAPGLAQICLELSARFLADALNESYFAWDPGRYPTRGAHNLVRGQAMWQLFQSVQERRAEAERILRRLLRT